MPSSLKPSEVWGSQVFSTPLCLSFQIETSVFLYDESKLNEGRNRSIEIESSRKNNWGHCEIIIQWKDRWKKNSSNNTKYCDKKEVSKKMNFIRDLEFLGTIYIYWFYVNCRELTNSEGIQEKNIGSLEVWRDKSLTSPSGKLMQESQYFNRNFLLGVSLKSSAWMITMTLDVCLQIFSWL